MDPATFTPADSPLTIADVTGSPQYQDLFTPVLSPGEVAFDFVLPRLAPAPSRSACRTSPGASPLH